jgi:SAM-dependent methyltransferase
MFDAAAGYERYMGRWSRQLAPRFLAFAGPGDGDRVLDIGTGTGALVSTIAATIRGGEVVGIDRSPAMIEHARRTSTSERTRFEIGDVQELPFPDASFDTTVAMLVLNFVPDSARAVGEMRRVTRPGGVVSACVWDYHSGMQMLRLFWDEASALDPGAAERNEGTMKFSREGELGAAWSAAGLTGVTGRPLVLDQPFTSFADFWTPFLEGVGPAGAYVAGLPEERRDELAARLRARLLGPRPDGSFLLSARAWAVRGRVPTA